MIASRCVGDRYSCVVGRRRYVAFIRDDDNDDDLSGLFSLRHRRCCRPYVYHLVSKFLLVICSSMFRPLRLSVRASTSRMRNLPSQTDRDSGDVRGHSIKRTFPPRCGIGGKPTLLFCVLSFLLIYCAVLWA